MPTVALTTLGCKVNQFETEVIQGLFTVRGYTVVDFSDKADVYVINTCSVTHLGEKKSRQLIRRARRANPAGVIAVTGCFAQLSPEKIAADAAVDVIIGTQNREKIVDLVDCAKNEKRKINVVSDIMQADAFEDIPLAALPGRTRAFLKIQEGCENFCTYCIIPYARGPLRSRPLTSIINEAEKLVAGGFCEIVLTGIHLGAYGKELAKTTTLVDVVKALLNIKGLIRLRLGSLETIEVSEDLIDIIKEDSRMCPQLHLPLQSGDDQILAKMNRKYTTAEYLHIINSIQTTVRDIAITTDIIVGFPGETEEMFNNTLAFVDKANFARVHVFPYSPRAGTPAAEYPDQIAEDIKKSRTDRLRKLADKKADEFKQRFIGREMEVLFENSEGGFTYGITGNYIKLYTAERIELLGCIHKVHLEKNFEDGIWGTIV